MKKCYVLVLIAVPLFLHAVEGDIEYDWKSIEKPRDQVEAEQRVSKATEDLEWVEKEQDPQKRERDIALAKMKLAKAKYFENFFKAQLEQNKGNLEEAAKAEKEKVAQANIVQEQLDIYKRLAGYETVPSAEVTLEHSIATADARQISNMITQMASQTQARGSEKSSLIRGGGSMADVPLWKAFIKYAVEDIKEDSSVDRTISEQYQNFMLSIPDIVNFVQLSAGELKPEFGKAISRPEGAGSKFVVNVIELPVVSDYQYHNLQATVKPIDESIATAETVDNLSLRTLMAHADFPDVVKKSLVDAKGNFVSPESILPQYRDLFNEFNTIKNSGQDLPTKYDALLKKYGITNQYKAEDLIDQLHKIAYIQRQLTEAGKGSRVTQALMDNANDVIDMIRARYPVTSPLEYQILTAGLGDKSSAMVYAVAGATMGMLTNLKNEVNTLLNAITEQRKLPDYKRAEIDTLKTELEAVRKKIVTETDPKKKLEAELKEQELIKTISSKEVEIADFNLKLAQANNDPDAQQESQADKELAQQSLQDAGSIYDKLFGQYTTLFGTGITQKQSIGEQLLNNVQTWFKEKMATLQAKLGNVDVARAIRSNLDDIYTRFNNISERAKNKAKLASLTTNIVAKFEYYRDALDYYTKAIDRKVGNFNSVVADAQSVLSDLIYLRNQLTDQSIDQALGEIADFNISQAIAQIDTALNNFGISSDDRKSIGTGKNQVSVPTDPVQIKQIIQDAVGTDFTLAVQALYKNPVTIEKDPLYIDLQNKLLLWKSIDPTTLSAVDQVLLYESIRDAYAALHGANWTMLFDPKLSVDAIMKLQDRFYNFSKDLMVYEQLYNQAFENFKQKEQVQLSANELFNKKALTGAEIKTAQSTIDTLIQTFVQNLDNAAQLATNYRKVQDAIEAFKLQINNALVSNESLDAQIWLMSKAYNRMLNDINIRINYMPITDQDLVILSKAYIELLGNMRTLLQQVSSDRLALFRTKTDAQNNIVLQVAQEAPHREIVPEQLPQSQLIPAPIVPPPAPLNVPTDPNRSSLLDAIRKGTQLKPVSTLPPAAEVAPETLQSNLVSALKKRRLVIQEEEEGGGPF